MRNEIEAILTCQDLDPQKKLEAIRLELSKWQTTDELTAYIEPLNLQVPDGEYPGHQVNWKSKIGIQVANFRGRRFPYKTDRLLALGKALRHVQDSAVLFRKVEDLPAGANVSFAFGELTKTGTVIEKIDHRYLILSDGVKYVVPKHDISQA